MCRTVLIVQFLMFFGYFMTFPRFRYSSKIAIVQSNCLTSPIALARNHSQIRSSVEVLELSNEGWSTVNLERVLEVISFLFVQGCMQPVVMAPKNLSTKH